MSSGRQPGQARAKCGATRHTSAYLYAEVTQRRRCECMMTRQQYFPRCAKGPACRDRAHDAASRWRSYYAEVRARRLLAYGKRLGYFSAIEPSSIFSPVSFLMMLQQQYFQSSPAAFQPMELAQHEEPRAGSGDKLLLPARRAR